MKSEKRRQESRIMKKEIIICDFCNCYGHPGFSCIGCEKDCCRNCEYHSMDMSRLHTDGEYISVSRPRNLCKECCQKDGVKAILVEFDDKIYQLILQRDIRIREDWLND